VQPLTGWSEQALSGVGDPTPRTATRDLRGNYGASLSFKEEVISVTVISDDDLTVKVRMMVLFELVL
jgi:hypothetical protein